VAVTSTRCLLTEDALMSPLAAVRRFPSLSARRPNDDWADVPAKKWTGSPRAGNVGLAAGGTIACILLGLLRTPIAHITPEDCARIKPGMTWEQVVAILGGPPGRYDGVDVAAFRFDAGRPGRKPPGGRRWYGDRGAIEVVFDGRWCVARATFYPGRALGHDLQSRIIERLTRCTRRRWEEWWMWG
jgi:hypothetical protein